MNDALGSGRYGPAHRGSGNHHYGGGNDDRGGGGGGRYRRGGRQQGYNNNVMNRQHHPYGNSNSSSSNSNDNNNRQSRRPREQRSTGNRFQTTNSSTVNPATAMENQLRAMVSRVGELHPAAEKYTGKRPVIQVITENIGNLVAALTDSNSAALFLKYQTIDNTGVDNGVNLAHLILSCVSTLPLQTGCYAALTMAVDQKSPQEFKGFASRCLNQAAFLLTRDFDHMLLQTGADISMCMNRILHIIKYLAILSKIGVVCPYDQTEDVSGTSELTMAAFLSVLTTASVKMAERNSYVASLLAHLVLSTVPYVMDCIPHDFIVHSLLDPLEHHVIGTDCYKSTFAPGVGKSAILLKAEQREGNDEDNLVKDEEDNEDDEEDDASTQCCDTLQDLYRSVKALLSEGIHSTRFALFTDAPWDGLKKQEPNSHDVDTDTSSTEALVYTSESLRLTITSTSILGIVNDIGVDVQCFRVDTVIYGRLPIFGSPIDDDDEEDDIEINTNDSLQAYQKGYGLSDRYFLSDMIRDVIVSHQSSVSNTGLDRGTAKNTAEQCWAVSHILLPSDEGVPENQAIAYPIVETILSLIIQSTESGTLRHIYLCRVLMELIRLKPDVIPQALAIGVANIVQHYLPSLVPLARDNFSRWLSFHLTNLDYQWPPAFWAQWAGFVDQKNRSSRGGFVARALSLMASNVSSISILVKECLPTGSPLVSCFFGAAEDEGSAGVFASLGLDIRFKIWETKEDPDMLRAYILSDEVSETVAGGINLGEDDFDTIWWRTNAMIHGLLHSAESYQAQTKESIKIAVSGQGDVVVTEDDNTTDVYEATMECLVRYKTVLSAVLAKDAEAYKERLMLREESSVSDVQLIEAAHIYLLQQVQIIVPNSRTIMEGCIVCLIENELVEVRSVLCFLLDKRTKLMERWWEIASTAIRLGLDISLSSVDKNLGDVMKVDGDDSTTSERSVNIVVYAEQIVPVVVGLVCDALASIDGRSLSLLPEEVDLVEGVKLVVLSTLSTLMIKLTAADEESAIGISTSKGRILLDESNISQSKLSSLCRNKGNTPALNILSEILEAIY